MNTQKNNISLIISVLLVLITIGMALFKNYSFNIKNYFGTFLLLVSIVIYFKHKKIYFFFWVSILLIGIVNLIDFFFINIIFEIGGLKINPIFVILFFIFLFQNKLYVDKKISNNDKKEKSKKTFKNELKKLNKVEHFERKFQSKTKSELYDIIDENNSYVDEARIAAKNILTKKNN